MPAAGSARQRPSIRAARYGPCTAPAAKRAPDNPLDMGTGFDCFDVRSYTRSAAITPAAAPGARNLRAAMTRGTASAIISANGGTTNSPARPLNAYDFPIEAR